MRSQRPAVPLWPVAVAVLVCGAIGLGRPAAALAQEREEDSAVAAQVKKLNAKALEEFDSLDFDDARATLEKVLQLCADNDLDRSPGAARAHLRLGVVMLVGFKQRAQALEQFHQALEIRPHIRLPEKAANPEVEEVFREAVARFSAPPVEGDGAPPAAPEAAPRKIGHAPIRKAPQSEAIAIRATVGAELAPKKVVLAYRAEGSPDFIKTPMKEDSPGHWSGEILPSATNGDEVAYYIEAQDDAGAAIASRGTAARPLVVALKEAGAPEETVGDQSDEEDTGPHLFLGVALGGGAGWTSGRGENTPNGMVSPAKIAPASLGHIAPELGFFLNEGLLLSLQLRLQYVTGTTPQNAPAGSTDCGPDHICYPARSAVAGFARATWLWGEENLHPYLAATVGGGYIRHVATLKNVATCGDPAKPVPCVDTVAAGPVFVGGGAGLFYNLGDNLALTLGLSALLGFTTFTAHVDVNGGIALEF